ncbi:amidohydrolase [Vibrio sp. SCSIO 43135]|uniref:M20 aminoacylase family protein n=1 Tax=Vibrio sp. SCSIO 43135 TaxID=2819096 RepID=UPI0020752D2E|nr:M20 aminoacylase family protein [Vibrio sp. SCSIO 43135]USD42709.1 amidohydrolase [Vibrio sp. SCSIO 43135]
MNIVNQLEAWLPEMIEIRHRLHKHPEIGFEEHQTQQLVATTLESYGISDISTGYGKTGVVANIQGNAGDGKTIGLRADMDALPIHEENQFEHRSCHDGKMHACGHDGHTTMLLYAAKYLSQNRDFRGKVVLIFQPAEEGVGGAKKMIEDGVIEDYQIDECYALHNMPGIPAGHFAFKSGPIMASSDRLFIKVKGKSGHAGIPQNTQDPLLVATHIYQGIQALVSRTTSPFEPVVVSVTQLHCGETTNAIADVAEMSGTFRTLSVQVRDRLVEQLNTLVVHTAKAYGMEAEFHLGPVSHPPTVNTETQTELAVQAARAISHTSQEVDSQCEALLASEDFSMFLQHVPGCYGFIGNGVSKDGKQIGLHHKNYDFNNTILPIGAAYFISLVNQQ